MKEDIGGEISFLSDLHHSSDEKPLRAVNLEFHLATELVTIYQVIFVFAP